MPNKNNFIGIPRLRSPKVVFAAFVFLVSSSLVPAAGGEEHKADALLRLILRGGHLGELTSTRIIGGQETTGVILLAASDIASQLRALGVHVRSVIDGDPLNMTADVPLRGLPEVLAIPELKGAQASQRLFPTVDRSVPESRINRLWDSSFKGLPVRGRGVLVAVVDTGIAWRQGDFKDAQGKTRILEIWDQQASAGTPAEGFGYGNVCNRTQIDQGQCVESDTNGHGTHVAGIAAGNGLSTQPAKFVGGAPEAELLIVKAILDTDHVVDAWKYIVDKAGKLGRPVVINNSFGGHHGPRDGTSPMEMSLDRLSSVGVVFTVAAGNSGASAIHAQGTLAQGQSSTTTYTFPEPSPLNASLLSIWYSAADLMSTSVTAPDGAIFGPVPKGQSSEFNV